MQYCSSQDRTLLPSPVTFTTGRYDLNKIPYDYTVEVTNRFKGLDLIDRVPEEIWFVTLYAAGDQWRNNSRKNEGMEPKQKQYSTVDVTGDRSKVQCCKEQYCIGTWNVRSMNQGKLEVVKEELARVNIDILGISELKWTGMGEFSSDDHYIYYCGQESVRRNGVAIIVHKRD